MRMEGFKKISDDLERVIEKDDSNSSMTTESEDEKQVNIELKCHDTCLPCLCDIITITFPLKSWQVLYNLT